MSHQLFRGSLHALRTFALRLEFPTALGAAKCYTKESGEAVSLVDATYERYRDMSGTSKRFAHLCNFSDVQGFYLPCDFEPVLSIKDPTLEGSMFPDLEFRPVGSSMRLKRELDDLNETLKLRGRWPIPAFNYGNPETDDEDLRDVHIGWLLMEGFARASVQEDLPICFDG